MKNLLICLIGIFSFTQLQAQETFLPISQTPKQIKSYIEKYFPETNIISIKKDKEFLSTEYEVFLNSQVQLEFDKNYNIKKMESKSALPMVALPKKISGYVSQNYPNHKILEWEKESRTQKIELDNGLDLVFDRKGNYMGIDD